MANIVSNQVTIYADEEKVREYILSEWPHSFFNMHKIYPGKLTDFDQTGFRILTKAWLLENTGCSSLTYDIKIAGQGSETTLFYSTRWTPNWLCLFKLHHLTWWGIELRFIPEGETAFSECYFAHGVIY